MKNIFNNNILKRFSSTANQPLFSEPPDKLYESQNHSDFLNLYNSQKPPIYGYANKEGTKLYSVRNTQIAPNHFKKFKHQNLLLSSIGIGTYIGSPTEIDDVCTFNAVVDSVLSGGLNVIDTAINYRYQKSERTVGAALRFLIEKKKINREEIFISTKGGYIPEDSDKGITANTLITELVKKNIISQEDIVGECHCMHPNFLKHQLEASLQNLNINTIDLLYLHNSAEAQLPIIGEKRFEEKLHKAFEAYESFVQDNKIKSYGIASWLCFRSPSEEKGIHLSLEKIVRIAEKVGGKNHHFSSIQVPISLLMSEAFTRKWQEVNNKNEYLLTACRLLDIGLFASSPLVQGMMLQVPIPSNAMKVSSQGAKHIQFVRSMPSPSIISTLVGMKKSRHVKTNLEVIYQDPLTTEEFWEFMTPVERKDDENIKADLNKDNQKQ